MMPLRIRARPIQGGGPDAEEVRAAPPIGDGEAAVVAPETTRAARVS